MNLFTRILVLLPFSIIVSISSINGQLLDGKRGDYSRADTLRGSLNPARTCYDVLYYDLHVELDIDDKHLTGLNTMVFDVTQNTKEIQIDLFDNLSIDRVLFQGKDIDYKRDGHATFLRFPESLFEGDQHSVTIYYQGNPVIAKRPPWDGGFTWEKDENGDPWVGVSCEGLGASSWWPNKDHLSDEPDSMRITCTVPDNLFCVSNGQLEEVQELGRGKHAYHWFVENPINNYNVTLNVANYVHFSDVYESKETGKNLDLDYYVLSYNLEKAQKHFKQVKPMMSCFEKYFGPYPFYEDGYCMVETPYLGMEHQGAIAYGNKYMKGYLGRHMEGIEFDYIIIHETGHEWWGNSVSCQDMADLWIHEAFTTYSEALYVECVHGYRKSLAYINRTKDRIGNSNSMVGDYGVNNEGDGDMYNKGSLFLNTLRHILQDEELWFRTLRAMSDEEFRHKTVHYDDILAYYNLKTGIDHTKIFEQYLKHPKIPKLYYMINKKDKKWMTVHYRFETDVEDFAMPVRMKISKRQFGWVEVTNEWQSFDLKIKRGDQFMINEDVTYIDVERLRKP